MLPQIISGNIHSDDRGSLYYNNDFNASAIKRIYFIENRNTDFVRAWQGHKIEQRWFSAANGSFEIKLIAVDNWETPSLNLEQHVFTISSQKLDVLHIPAGYISSIRALTDDAKLLVMADYALGEIKDEYRYDAGYFDVNK
ncbi:MAG: sugar epimerase [Flavobacterium psychrophilum]|nr:MAG: sugar epimerase [Flavobacterium psychrophilum]